MKRLIIAAALAGTTIAGMAVAQNAAPAAAPGKRAMALDLDKDGIITRAEVTAAADARFALLDTNRDGTVSASERPNRRGGNVADMTRDQLRAKSLARFDRADGNKDGRIEQTERRGMRGGRGRDRAGMGEPGADGERMRRGGGRHGRGGGGMAAMMMADANRDGIITKVEAVSAAERLFDRVDANRDGRIDQAEREAARGAMKMRRGARGDAPDNGAR